jgi:hypothetical protein
VLLDGGYQLNYKCSEQDPLKLILFINLKNNYSHSSRLDSIAVIKLCFFSICSGSRDGASSRNCHRQQVRFITHL